MESQQEPAPDQVTVFEIVGSQYFVDLVDQFYVGVESDELLRPMYPNDLTGARERLAGFLVQYWGGPATYSEERGHPRLRMRHAPFAVGTAARDAWVSHMLAALTASDAPDPVKEAIGSYFVNTAEFLRNAE